METLPCRILPSHNREHDEKRIWSENEECPDNEKYNANEFCGNTDEFLENQISFFFSNIKKTYLPFVKIKIT